MTPQEEAALLRVGLAAEHERRELAIALQGASIGTALVEASTRMDEALEDWRRLRFSPTGKLLMFPGDEGYRPGAGPCPLCSEPGEGTRCRCYASEVVLGDVLHPHRTRTGAVLRVVLDKDRGALCTRDACPQYRVQPELPNHGGDRARSVCAMSGKAPGNHCEPRALDIVEMLHSREVSRAAARPA